MQDILKILEIRVLLLLNTIPNGNHTLGVLSLAACIISDNINNESVGLNGLIELPKYDIDYLKTSEAIIRNCTNSLFADLKLSKPLNITRINDFASIHRYFLSLTFRDSDDLKEIARLTRVNYKSSNNSVENENLTRIINELLDENTCGFYSSDVDVDDNDASVVTYVDRFLEKLERLKESYGVNKVFADINSNIVKIFRNANELYSTGNEFINSTEDNIDNFTLLDSGEVWVLNGRRIYQGKRTKIKYFPFMAGIEIFNTFQCAGSIIKSDLIITASSCLQLAWNNRFYRENPAFLSVRVGSSFYNSGGESIPVLEIYFHPEYNPKTLRNNICVMRLLRHIKFRYRDRRKVQKIAIDKNPWNLPINTPGITIVGWGAKGNSKLGNPWENILSYAILDVYPLKECQEVYSKEYVTMKNFCGGFFSKGSGACNRDVGAPGVVDGILMGVVSFGSPVCGTPDVPTVFTKLGYYYRWIQNIMKMKVPRSKKRTTLEITRDPYAAYMTTPYTTTTFKIEPLVGEIKPMPAFEEDEEAALRMLDNKLFQDFLMTMFDDKNLQKYVRGKEKTDAKTESTGVKEKDSLVEQQMVESPAKSSSTEHEDDSDNAPSIHITAGYESEKDGKEFTEDDFPATKYTPEQQQPYKGIKFIPVTKMTANVARNIDINYASTNTEYINQLTSPNTDPPPEIQLELATESSYDSDDSEQLRSDDNDKVPSVKDLDMSSSGDISDVPGKEAIAELLDEIDLQEILKEVAGDKNTSLKPSSQNQFNAKTESPKSIFVTLATFAQKEIGRQNEVKNYKNSKKQDKDSESVLTLLYLSDDEKKNNINADSRNIITINNNRNNFNNATVSYKSKSSNSIYDIVPKSKVYKIISEVIKAAIDGKDDIDESKE